MQFNTRADQLDYVFRKFILFVATTAKKCGLPASGLNELVDCPTTALIGKAIDIQKRWGDGLKKHDLSAVFQLIVEESPSQSPETMSQQGLKFVEHLKKHPEVAEGFFRYTDILLELLD